MLAVLTFLHGVSADQLIEKAMLVINQRETALLELIEEFVPADLLQIVVLRAWVVGKFDTDDPDIAARMRAPHNSRFAAVRFRPFADGVVVGGGV